MTFPELNEAVLNIHATEEGEQVVIFDTIYAYIIRRGLLCFDAQGMIMEQRGDSIIKETIEYYTSGFNWPERCWWLRKYLHLYENRFYGIKRDENEPGPLEFSTPRPKASWGF